MESLQASLASSSTILSAMLLLALVEAASPLFARGAANRAHLAPNLAMTLLTFATYAVLNAVLVAGLVWVNARDLGLLEHLGIGGLPAALIAVAALDLATYWGHVSMHKVPVLWRFHRVHHADPAVDVTTTLRQHPGEGVLRFAFAAAVAIPLGASPAVFALYRFTSGIFALLEHANIRVPERIDRWLSLVVPWPSFHKLHHAREPEWTDSNYGNLVTLWDRLFGTYTPAHLATQVSYGLAEFDAPGTQTTMALLAAPFARVPQERSAVSPPRRSSSAIH